MPTTAPLASSSAPPAVPGRSAASVRMIAGRTTPRAVRSGPPTDVMTPTPAERVPDAVRETETTSEPVRWWRSGLELRRIQTGCPQDRQIGGRIPADNGGDISCGVNRDADLAIVLDGMVRGQEEIASEHHAAGGAVVSGRNAGDTRCGGSDKVGDLGRERCEWRKVMCHASLVSLLDRRWISRSGRGLSDKGRYFPEPSALLEFPEVNWPRTAHN